MADEVHVSTSQADAARMIVERNSANGKPTPEAIRKIAEAQPEPVAENNNPPRPAPVVSSRRTARFRAFLASVFPGKAPRRVIRLGR